VVVLGNGDNVSTRAYMEGICIEEDNQCILSFLDISVLEK